MFYKKLEVLIVRKLKILDCTLRDGGLTYDLKPFLALIKNYYQNSKDVQAWGFCTKQLLTGIFNQHPVKSIQGTGDNLPGIYDHFQSGVKV